MKNKSELQSLIRKMDHRSYPALKALKDSYDFGNYILRIDHVQGDPFAAPSSLSVIVPGKKASFPKEDLAKAHRRVALEDFLLRRFAARAGQYSFRVKASGKSGLITATRPGQEILARSSCQADPESGDILVRFSVGFPAHGRSVDAGGLIKILFDFLPECVEKSLFYGKEMAEDLQKAVDLSDDQAFIRQALTREGLCAFVADGAILPRESGVSQRAMKGAVPFISPESLKVSFELPHAGTISGMGIRQGITLIVGGGYHGKSTLLKALELGVYNHIAGDGREFVITDDTAVKIRSEDGRSVRHTDISLFIKNLPDRRDTVSFETEDASGSTSQAANVVEAMEAGAKLLLIDEDTCATNFMVRDELMQRVVSKGQEPITPFTARIRGLYEKAGISTILVAGSSGTFFRLADRVIQMDNYKPYDITEKASAAVKEYDAGRGADGGSEQPKDTDADDTSFPDFSLRILQPDKSLAGRVKVRSRGKDSFSLDHEEIDLRYVEQLADPEQTNALARLLLLIETKEADGHRSLQEAVRAAAGLLREKGLAALSEHGYFPSPLALPRDQEIFACVNRYRKLKCTGKN